MWMLKDESGKLHYLKRNQPFVIGRNRGDLVLSEDGSISRAHAKIQATSDQCIVTDTNSKYGTFLLHEDGKNQQITGDYTVKNGDRIRFGLQTSILTINHINFVVLTSSMTSEDKAELLRIIEEIDGRIVPEWTKECTHLTVSSTKLTAKLSCSLAVGLPIVTMKYWIAVKTAQESEIELPDPRDFTAILDDPMLCTSKSSLLPNPLRKTVFSNLLFVHFRKNQMQIYKKIIELAGGKSVFFGSQNFDKKLLSDKNTRLVLYSEDNTQDEPYNVPKLSSLQRFLKESKRRMIPETEIPLAILYSSIQNYCNPEFSYEDLLKAGREKKIDEGETLVADTQDIEGRNKSICKKKMIIPETESFGVSQHNEKVGETSQINRRVENDNFNVNEKCGERKRSRSIEDEDGGEKRARLEDSPEDGRPERVFSCIKSRKIDKTVEKVGENEKSTANVNNLEEIASIGENSEGIESQKLVNIRKIFSGSVSASQKRIIPETKEEDDYGNDDENIEIDIEIFKEPIQEEIEKNEIIEESNEDREEQWTRIEDDGGIERIDESGGREAINGAIGDADCSILRREFFSGERFGKCFRKAPVNIPENRINEWGVGQWA